MTPYARPSEEAKKAAREVVAEWDRTFDADEPQDWADITAREWLIRNTALLLDRREAQALERAAKLEELVRIAIEGHRIHGLPATAFLLETRLRKALESSK